MKLSRFKLGGTNIYFLTAISLSAICASGQTQLTYLTFSNLTVGESYQLQKRFTWYWINVPTTITPTNSVYSQMVTGFVQSANYRLAQNPVPAQAFAIANVINDSVDSAIITDGGSGYVTAPMVSIVHGGGSNAMATASISSSGVVNHLFITNPGSGYTTAPVIQIEPPPAVPFHLQPSRSCE